ncbi:MAG: hypothetical protein PHX53_00170 [Syntrophales bacterium]|nr:hypothetical protein [Syntrophales bacterium]
MTGQEHLIAALFGGREKLDCWLTQAADHLADPEIAEPTALPVAIPERFRDLMRRPREVIDGLLEKLHELNTWGYGVRVQGGLATVTDDLTGHVVETVPVNTPEEVQALAEKYGPRVDLEAQ